MKLSTETIAPDFEGKTMDGKHFKLSDYKGKKILLSFFRNGACALCNLRIHELITNYAALSSDGMKIVAVFESAAEGMLPYVGKQQPPFILLADPKGELYSKYGVESSQEKINVVMQSNIAHDRINEAALKGFSLTQQENSNFFRLPADFLIDEDFIIRRSHYSDQIIDHLELEEVLEFAKKTYARKSVTMI